MSSSKLPIRIIQTTGYVGGVTSLDDEVFIVRWNSPQVDVFDANTMSPTRTIQVPGLGPNVVRGLAACDYNRCLYVLSCDDATVHRIELRGEITKWSVATKGNYGLSVNSSHNALVAGYYTCKLYEYTTHGQLLKTITLQSGIQHPSQAIQLPPSNGDTVFCAMTYAGLDAGLCVVDENGQPVKSYLKKSPHLWFYCPNAIAISSRGFMFVADRFTSRIVVVNTEKLGCNADVGRELPVSVYGRLQEPVCLSLDESRDRLYIAERESGRVLVIDSVALMLKLDAQPNLISILFQ